jgi:hypothetical protein
MTAYAISGLRGGLGVVFAFYWVFMANTKLALYEHGIWAYTGLIRWDRINDYSWKNGNTLIFVTNRRLPMFGRGALPIPPQQVDEFKQLLDQHIAHAAHD